MALPCNSLIPTGVSETPVTLAGKTLRLFAYKPVTFSAASPLFVVFHGVLRNADTYRDHAIPLGDRFNALIIAPLFDDAQFPTAKYQHGGVLSADGALAPRAEWTYTLVPQLIAHLRQSEQCAHLPCYLIGHSAGGQFVERMIAFSDQDATRVIAANPGTHLFPTRDLPFAYGFGDLPTEVSDDAALQRYLAQPLTLYLGTADDHPDEHFDDSPDAMRQGESRYARGQALFAFAQNLAREKGWQCNWRLVTVAGVGHDHEKMFGAPEVARALFGE